ncbi:fibronectin type III domain-containing protein [Nitrosopumilus sp. Nsub]|uniref:fibronectin type III domain-containing protein n=1 Tax=Nitrosopumilus sp. Nsub TaxID=1776294 RepID=UPI00155EA2D4|nr:fibronectin type III domain-containing protein [Nitrosopumilus sp. Nsub]
MNFKKFIIVFLSVTLLTSTLIPIEDSFANDGSSITEVATLEHDEIWGAHNSLVQVDSDTYALAYSGEGNDGYISTFTITSSTTAPSQVGTVTVTPGTDTTALSWSAPSDGGSSITDYIIQISPDDSNWSTFSDGTSTATTATVTGLPKGTAYYFKVAAVNSVGTGSYSSSGSGTSYNYAENYTFTGTQSFDTGTRFQAGTTFKANQDFSGGAMTFGANQVFDEGTKFAASQSFGSAQTFGDAQEFGSGGTFAAANTWGEKADFSAGTQTFNAAQTFGAAAKFAANQDFTNVDHDFSAAAMFFNSGGQFSAGEVMGVGADFSSGAQTFGAGMTFGESTAFADSQDWGANAQTFDKYMHFGDSNDFTGKIQTFMEGTSFGSGTTFKDTQTIPVNTIPAFGVMLEQITCGTDTSANTCIPNDASKYLAPGEFLTAGQDPAATSNSISSNDKSFAVEGAGLEMSFASVTGDGTITSDLYDPANIPASTAVGDTGKVSVSTSNAGTVETIGSVTNVSTGTATISGDITITLSYTESNIPAGTAESDLTMIHYTGGEWKTESNCTVDETNNKISCTVTSLSPFGVGGSGSGSGSSSSSSGGGGNNCDSKGFGTGKSLMVYNVNYSIDTNLVTLQAYSTCGTVSASVTTDSGKQSMGLSLEQPLIDENIVLYSAILPEGITDFSIAVNNKKNTFDERYYPHGNDLNRTYTGETMYTSQQQGTSITSGYTSDQHGVVANTAVDVVMMSDEKIVKPIANEMVNEKQNVPKTSESISQYIPEPVADSVVSPVEFISEASYISEPVESNDMIPSEPQYIPEPTPTCGMGTVMVDGYCVVLQNETPKPWWKFW